MFKANRLLRHVQTVHETLGVHCDECDKVFNRKDILFCHKRTVHSIASKAATLDLNVQHAVISLQPSTSKNGANAVGAILELRS